MLITVELLQEMGLGGATTGGLNGDGVVDVADTEAFMRGVRSALGRRLRL